MQKLDYMYMYEPSRRGPGITVICTFSRGHRASGARWHGRRGRASEGRFGTPGGGLPPGGQPPAALVPPRRTRHRGLAMVRMPSLRGRFLIRIDILATNSSTDNRLGRNRRKGPPRAAPACPAAGSYRGRVYWPAGPSRAGAGGGTHTTPDGLGQHAWGGFGGHMNMPSTGFFAMAISQAPIVCATRTAIIPWTIPESQFASTLSFRAHRRNAARNSSVL
jgi:hypothetical protein